MAQIQATIHQAHLTKHHNFEAWDGDIAALRFYEDRILTGAEILENYTLISGDVGDPAISSPDSLSLGQLPAFPTMHSGFIRVINIGATQTLNIESVGFTGTNADQFTVTDQPDQLGPGESGDVTFTFDTQERSGGFAATLEIKTNDAETPVKKVVVSANILNLSGPVAHYRFDDPVSTLTLLDASGFERDGLYAPGDAGTVGLEQESLLGDGDANGKSVAVSGGAQAEVPATAFEVFDALTVSLWIHPTTNSGTQTLFAKGLDSPDFALISLDGALGWFIDGDPTLITDTPVLVEGESQHVVVVASNREGEEQLRYYVNGAEVASEESPILFDDLGEGALYIGAFNHLLAFEGRLDAFQIYDRAVTPEQVTQLFENPTETLGDGVVDSDGDGLSDREEFDTKTDPLDADSDDDKLSDGVEHALGTDPNNRDTDGDGFPDASEQQAGTDPKDAGSAPQLQALPFPEISYQFLGALPTFNGNRDTEDMTFRLYADFEAKTGGEREVLFESGGGTVGSSLVYEAPSELVYRSAGAGGFELLTIRYPLSEEQLAAGELEVIITYDVEDDLGQSSIALYVDGGLIDALSAPLGGDWTGSNEAAFGVASGSLAGTGSNGALTGATFTSGTINTDQGLQFYPGTLFGLLADADGDGIEDAWEEQYFQGDLSQLSRDGDHDEDGLTDLREYQNGGDPTKKDTDGDGLEDAEEVNGDPASNPALADTDGDGLTDRQEVEQHMSHPAKVDTDGDGFSDGFEVENGSQPNNANSFPDVEIPEPTETHVEAMDLASFHGNGESFDTKDATWRVWIDFDEKSDGEREVIFETGAGTIGISMVYEAPSTLVLRSNGNGGFDLLTVEYPLTEADLAAGELDLIWTYDVNANPAGDEALSIFIEGVSVASDTLELGGDWSGTDPAAFAVASSNLAGTGNNSGLQGGDFLSGEINFELGLQYFGDFLYRGSSEDTDEDGLPDSWEERFFPGDLAKLTADGDADGDGLSDVEEFANQTDPIQSDSDADALDDKSELEAGTNPNVADTDGDGLNDGGELAAGTNPLDEDTDGDSYSDGFEVEQGSNPTDRTSLPADILGEPALVYTELGAHPHIDAYSQVDATFRVDVEFDEKTDGEREVIFEAGGGTNGFSAVYEAENKIVIRAAGDGGNEVVVLEHTLTGDQLAGGALELIWTYDVDNGNGESEIALYIDGESVGSAASAALGGDWSGTNGVTFGDFSDSVAAAGGNTSLVGEAFLSGTIDVESGLRFYTGRLFTDQVVIPGPEPGPEGAVITGLTRDANGVLLEWQAGEGESVDVQFSATLANWETIETGNGTGSFQDTDAGRTGGAAAYYRVVQP